MFAAASLVLRNVCGAELERLLFHLAFVLGLVLHEGRVGLGLCWILDIRLVEQLLCAEQNLLFAKKQNKVGKNVCNEE